MKHIEIFVGSPRKSGNTFILSNHLNDLLNSSGSNSHLSFVYSYNIEPCMDCRKCKSGNMTCSIKDEAKIFYRKLEDADTLVFGTPIYWFAPTAKIKLLIDRLRPYFVNKKLSGKKAAVILTAGSGEEDCDLTIEMFKRIFEVLEIKYLGSVVSQSYDIGDAADDKNAIEGIKNLSHYILNG